MAKKANSRTGMQVGIAGLKINEKDFMAQVIALSKLFSWESYHTQFSIRSARGWPDLSLCRPPRLILAELKSDAGKLTAAQERWLDLLGQCPGVEVYLWRPADFETIERVLR